MEYRQIGQLSVSVVGLGCNNFGGRLDEARTKTVVDAARDAGINFFDTADMYGGTKSEVCLGKALKDHRDEVVIATKFAAPGSEDAGVKRGSVAWVREAVERSLKRLAIDHIDLYQMHFPDPEVEIAETLGALHDLVQAGKVREIGCSNFSNRRLNEAADVAGAKSLTPFKSLQNRYSLLHRDPEVKGVLESCARRGVGFIPYFPLESGLLTGKYAKGEALPEGTRLSAMPESQRERFLNDERLEAIAQLRDFAEARGHGLLDLAVSWLASNPTVSSVIAGATRPEQVAANADAAGWKIGADDRAEIDTILQGLAS
jgi:aryl-alcohol dehydrogenase-like predicted oxidoreductase